MGAMMPISAAGVFKQRIAREGAGKSSGFRSIVFFKKCSHVLFFYGFAESEKTKVTVKELAALKRLADLLMGFRRRPGGRACLHLANRNDSPSITNPILGRALIFNERMFAVLT